MATGNTAEPQAAQSPPNPILANAVALHCVPFRRNGAVATGGGNCSLIPDFSRGWPIGETDESLIPARQICYM